MAIFVLVAVVQISPPFRVAWLATIALLVVRIEAGS